MTLIEHGELVRRALEYVQEERCRRPDAPLSSLLDRSGYALQSDAAGCGPACPPFFRNRTGAFRPVQTLTLFPYRTLPDAFASSETDI